MPRRLEFTNDRTLQLQTVGMDVDKRTPADIRSWFKTLSEDPYSLQVAIDVEDPGQEPDQGCGADPGEGSGQRSGRLYVGDIDLHSINPYKGEAWVELLLGDPRYRTAEVAVDALRTLLRFAFGELGLKRVQAEVLETNPVVRQALEQVGFVPLEQVEHSGLGITSEFLELTRGRFID